MIPTSIAIAPAQLAGQLGGVVRTARLLAGWTQRELARRSGTSQSTVCRVELGVAEPIDLLLLGRMLAALGIDASLELDARHLADRERQVDAVHAVVNGFSARRHERHGWLTATEVQVGDEAPRGWIDLLAFRPADRALLVQETKTDIHDMGALQRSVAFYLREAWACAERLGWRPSRTVAIVVGLDSVAMARRLADNRDLVERAFPGRVEDLVAWLEDPASAAPARWTLAGCDPASRARPWLRPILPGSRSGRPAYVDCADAARRLLGR